MFYSAQLQQHLKALARRLGAEVDYPMFDALLSAPVIVQEGNRRWVRPMRYHCRRNGKPVDCKFDGLYSARRDSLESFWRDLYGTHHAIMIAPTLL